MANPPTQETGYAAPDPYQWVAGERVSDLQWPNSIDVYARMGREDGRVESLIQAIALPVRQTHWSIDPNGARDEVVEFVADSLGLPIKGVPDEDRPRTRTRRRFRWDEHLNLVTRGMLQYGHAFFEQVYEIDDDGRARLRKLAPRPQSTIAEIRVERDGGLHSIVQHSPSPLGAGPNRGPQPSTYRGAEIPVSALVAYVRDQEPGLWIGRSILRPAYKHWTIKDELMRVQAAAARRNGMGIPVATAAEGASDEDVERLRDMASAYVSGMRSGVGLPYGADLKLAGVSGNLPDLQQAIDYQDKQISLSGLAHFLNLDAGGSFALAAVQERVFVQSIQSFAKTIATVANAHVVEDLVDVNWGEQEPAPLLVFNRISAQHEAVADSLKTLVDADILRPDRSLEQAVRDDFNLPAKDLPVNPLPPEQREGGGVDG